MAYVISHDMGIGNAPAFLQRVDNGMAVWGMLDTAQKFQDEALAQSVIDGNDLYNTITMPFDVDVTP